MRRPAASPYSNRATRRKAAKRRAARLARDPLAESVAASWVDGLGFVEDGPTTTTKAARSRRARSSSSFLDDDEEEEVTFAAKLGATAGRSASARRGGALAAFGFARPGSPLKVDEEASSPLSGAAAAAAAKAAGRRGRPAARRGLTTAQLEVKCLTLPFLDQLEYVRMQVDMRLEAEPVAEPRFALTAPGDAILDRLRRNEVTDSSEEEEASDSDGANGRAERKAASVSPDDKAPPTRGGTASSLDVPYEEVDPASLLMARAPPLNAARAAKNSAFTSLVQLLGGGARRAVLVAHDIAHPTAAYLNSISLKYPRFRSLLEAPGVTTTARLRSLPWILTLIEEVYDTRFAVEAKGGFASKKAAAINGPCPAIAFAHIRTKLGLRSLVEQTSWDLLYTLDALCGALERYVNEQRDSLGGDDDGTGAHANQVRQRLELFAFFLREMYDQDALVFYLQARHMVQRNFHLSLGSLEQLLPDGESTAHTTRQWMPLNAVVVVPHPVLSDGTQEPFLSEWSVKALCYALLHDIDLSSFLLEQDSMRKAFVLLDVATAVAAIGATIGDVSVTGRALDGDIDGGSIEETKTFGRGSSSSSSGRRGAFATKELDRGASAMISVAAFLYALLDVFRRTPDDIINDLKGGNGADTLDMLKRLMKSTRYDADAETQAGVLGELELNVMRFEADVNDLKRRNVRDGGALATDVFLAESVLRNKMSDLEVKRNALKNTKMRALSAWQSIFAAQSMAEAPYVHVRQEQEQESAKARLSKHRELLTQLARGGEQSSAMGDLQIARRPLRSWKEKPSSHTVLYCITRMGAWLRRKREQERIANETAKLFAQTWTSQREELEARYATKLQSAFRARRDAKAARAQAALELDALRLEKRDARKKYADEVMAVERARLAAAQDLKRRQEEASRKFFRHMLDAQRASFQTLRLHTKAEQGIRKRRLEFMKHYFKMLHGIAMMKHAEYRAGLSIQMWWRGLMAAHLVQRLKERASTIRSSCGKMLRRILHRGKFKYFLLWHNHAHQQVEMRRMYIQRLTHAAAKTFQAWQNFMVLADIEVSCSARTLQRAHRRRLRRQEAACQITNFFRIVVCSNLAQVIRSHKQKQANLRKRTIARIKNRLVYKIYSSWWARVVITRGVKRLRKKMWTDRLGHIWTGWAAMAVHQRELRGRLKRRLAHKLGRLERLMVSRWKVYTAESKAQRIKAAVIMQKAARRRARFAQLDYRSSSRVIQHWWRGVYAKFSYHWMIARTWAATKIQARWRGKIARRGYNKERLDLVKAVRRHDYRSVEEALDDGKSLAMNTDEDGNTGLHLAARSGSKRIVKLCLRYGFAIDFRNTIGETPLHYLVQGHMPGIETIAHYLCQHGSYVDEKDAFGETALIHAARSGNLACVRTLVLDCGAHPDHHCKRMPVGHTRPHVNGGVALHAAAAANHHGIVRFLLENGADPMQKDADGTTALMDAATRGSIEVITTMMEYGVPTDAVDGDDFTALHFAVTNNQLDCVETLLSYGANADAIDKEGRSPAIYAAFDGFAPIITMLFEIGAADPTTQDTDGENALHAACVKGRTKALEVLLGNATPVTAIDQNGDLPLHIACANGFIECVKLLVDYDDESINVKNFFGRTPLGEARMGNHQEIVEYLGDNFDVEVHDWIEEGVLYNDEELEDLASAALVPKRVLAENFLRRKVKQQTAEQAARGGVDGTLSAVDYGDYFNEMNAEAVELTRRTKAARQLQQWWRYLSASKFMVNLAAKAKASSRLAAATRGWRDRRRVKLLARDWNAAKCIQRQWRFRKRHLVGYAALSHRKRDKNVKRLARECGRVWRGYRGRCKAWRQRMVRGLIHTAQIPPGEAPIASFLVFNEYRDAKTNMLFYHNTSKNSMRWERPLPWILADGKKKLRTRMLAELGYDPEEVEGATVLQCRWRGKIERRKWRRRRRGIALMQSSEMTYLRAPKKISAMCNYAIYLHATKQDYARAAKLWDKTVQAMQHRGPDVASVLWGYAVFQWSTAAEEDFDTVLALCDRAYEVERADQDAHYDRCIKKGERVKAISVEWIPSFALARDGFFRQASLDQCNDGNTLHNYACCLSLYDQDFETAEKYFLKAVKCSPHDATIIRNFNLMLERLAGKEYDGYEALLNQQAKVAEVETLAAANRRREALELWAATKLQSVARGRLAKKHRADGSLVVRNHAQSAAVRFLETTIKTAPAAAVSDANWEELQDEATGQVYYYSPTTGETTYERPAALAVHDIEHHHESIVPVADSGWEENVTEEGVSFWYSTVTGESVWEDPHVGGGGSTAMTRVDSGGGGDWEAHVTEDGHEYFYNAKTEESTWERPAALWKSIRSAVHFGAHAGAVTEDASEADEFEECKDEHGNAYWYSRHTGNSQWEEPSGWGRLRGAVSVSSIIKHSKHAVWEELASDDGTPYYYNPESGETAWEIPT